MTNSKNDNISSWTIEKGFDIDDSSDSIPLRVLGSGVSNGLNVQLKIHEEDIDYICRGPVQGFKVLIHTTSDMPQATAEYIRIPPSREVIVAMSPNIITTSEDLRHYSPEKYVCV